MYGSGHWCRYIHLFGGIGAGLIFYDVFVSDPVEMCDAFILLVFEILSLYSSFLDLLFLNGFIVRSDHWEKIFLFKRYWCWSIAFWSDGGSFYAFPPCNWIMIFLFPGSWSFLLFWSYIDPFKMFNFVSSQILCILGTAFCVMCCLFLETVACLWG